VEVGEVTDRSRAMVLVMLLPALLLMLPRSSSRLPRARGR
jgi:hypothetical protein